MAEGIRRCEEIRSEVAGHLEAEALTLRHLAALHAMNGDFALARSLLAASNGVFADLGLTLNAATSHNEALIEMLAGDFAAAERSLRTGHEALTEMGEQAFLSTTAAFLARAVLAQGRLDEAAELAQQSAELAEPGDLLTQIMWRGVQARVLAAQRPARGGRGARARGRLARRGDRLPGLPRRRADRPRAPSSSWRAGPRRPRPRPPRRCISITKRGISSTADDIRSHLEAL